MKFDIPYRPYTYLIGWSKLDIWYYGARWKKEIANPTDLWISYFTSSKYVEDFRKLHGEPDVVQIRKAFCDAKSCRAWENKVLKRMKVVKKKNWLNKNDSNSFSHPGRHSEKTKQKIREAHIGMDNHRDTPKWRAAIELNRQKATDAIRGKPKSPEFRKMVAENNKKYKTGTKHSEEAKAKMRASRRAYLERRVGN